MKEKSLLKELFYRWDKKKKMYSPAGIKLITTTAFFLALLGTIYYFVALFFKWDKPSEGILGTLWGFVAGGRLFYTLEKKEEIKNENIS